MSNGMFNGTLEWQCQFCTFINSSANALHLASNSRIACEMCGKTSLGTEVKWQQPFQAVGQLQPPDLEPTESSQLEARRFKLIADRERHHMLELAGLQTSPAVQGAAAAAASRSILGGDKPFARFSLTRQSDRGYATERQRYRENSVDLTSFACPAEAVRYDGSPVDVTIAPTAKGVWRRNVKVHSRRKSNQQSAAATVASATAECPVCLEKKPPLKVPLCGCSVCSECLCQHIEVRLHNDSSVSGLTCPVCVKLDDQALTDIFCEYFPQLRSLLVGRLKPPIMEQLDERLRDWRLKLTNNFCWCSGCSNGFEVSEHYDRQVRCPHCGKETCRKCGQAWHEKHRGVSCQQFGSWLQRTDLAQRGLTQFLESRGSKCPKCGFQFELSRGGCLHLKCLECSAEFCSDCGGLFVRTESKGLHCQHGSECIEKFRDWPIKQLRQAASERGVQLTMSGAAGSSGGRCRLQEQKETSSGLADAECGRPAVEAGLCEAHLKEALVSAMRRLQESKSKSTTLQPPPPPHPDPRSILRRPKQLDLSALSNKLSESPSRELFRSRYAREVSGAASGASDELTCPHCTSVTPSAPRVSGGSRLLCNVCGKTTPNQCRSGGANIDADLAALNSYLVGEDEGIQIFN